MNLFRWRSNPNTKLFWDKKYGKYIEDQYIRSDRKHLDKFMTLFQRSGSILDFGSGLGGNIEYLSHHLEDKKFMLLDLSETSLAFSKNKLLGLSDDHGNRFEYCRDLGEIPPASIDLVMSIEVLEHITNYGKVLDQLWDKLKTGGILLISVPVLGIRDRTRVHVNKFTVKGMFQILSRFNDIVHIAARTYSKKSGRLSTAYFYVEK